MCRLLKKREKEGEGMAGGIEKEGRRDRARKIMGKEGQKEKVKTH